MTRAGFKTDGFEQLQRKLKSVGKETKDKSVSVGYTANYAIYVHEMIDAVFRRPGSQSKFLEQPLRELERELKGMVVKLVKRGISVEQALFMAGLRLQKASQDICPVDTGNLRASAYTRID